MFTQKFLISVLVIVCCAIPASASLVECTTTSCFTAATTGDTFSSISVTQGSLGTSFVDDGVDFANPNMTGVASPSPWPTGTAIEVGSLGTITISSLSGVNAIEFYVGTDVYVSVTDSTGGTYADSSPLTDGFFGITTTSAFTSFTISNDYTSSQPTIGDISIGTPAPGGDPAETPEAATLLLVATGLILMRLGRRWMPRRASSSAQAASRGTVCTMSTGITPA